MTILVRDRRSVRNRLQTMLRCIRQSLPVGMLLSICVACSGLLSLTRFTSIPVGAFFDDARYIVLAESMATGHGYRLINFPHAPIETAFPPGWPLLLTPFVTLTADNFILLKLLALVLWLACIPLMYTLFALRLQKPHAIGLTVLIASNALLIGMAGTVMSEAAYLFCSLLALYLFETWRQRAAPQRLMMLVAVMAVTLFAITIRTIGVALLAALLVYLLRSLRWRQVGPIAGVLLLGALPLAWFNAQRGGALIFSPLYQTHVTYVSAHVGYFARVWEHAATIPYRTIATAFVPMIHFDKVSQELAPLLNGLYGGGVLLLAGWGFLLALRRFRITELYVLFYVAILYVWIVYTGELRVRLLIPLIPFGYFYLLGAFLWGVRRWRWHTVRAMPALPMVVLGLVLFLNLSDNAYAWLNPTRERVPDLSSGTTWVRRYAPADAILMSVNPVPDYLYAQRRTLGYPNGADVDLDEYIEQNGIDYILVRPNLNNWDNHQHQLDPYVAEHLLPHLMAHPLHFETVYQKPDEQVFVYRVRSRE